MEYRQLGNTGLVVSRLCYGTLTMSPLQKGLSFEEGGSLIAQAYSKGVNFLDTADLYDNYGHIAHALKSIPRSSIVIATKSYAYDEKTALESVNRALKELNTEYIDIFLLHEQESEHTLRGHYEALETLHRLKDKGIIKAVGISTHHIKAVEAAIKEPLIEVIHPILNINGFGIQDGSVEEMADAIKRFHATGRGVYGMKPLGGGTLLHSVDACFDFMLEKDYLDSIATGMQNTFEISANVATFSGEEVATEIVEQLNQQPRQLMIHDWCIGCGKCIERCNMNALQLIDNKAVVDRSKCVTCGYCASVCPEVCIKVV